MTTNVDFAIESELPLPRETVWARVTTPVGINHELGPWVRMTVPRGLKGATLDDVALGQKLGRSWILVCFAPFEYDDLCLMEVEPRRRFLERSQMATLSPWIHERTLDDLADAPGSCRVRDHVRGELRPWLRKVPGSARTANAVVRTLFTHRHKRLRAWAHGIAAG